MILLQTEGKINQSALVVQNSAELQEARIKIGELTRLLNEAKETNLEKDLIISQITAQGQSHIAKIKSIEGEIFNRDKWYSEQFINM